MFTESDDVPLGEVLARYATRRRAKWLLLTGVRLLLRSCRTTSQRFSLTSTATVYTQVTSKKLPPVV